MTSGAIHSILGMMRPHTLCVARVLYPQPSADELLVLGLQTKKWWHLFRLIFALLYDDFRDGGGARSRGY